jgi:hypothetical protein
MSTIDLNWKPLNKPDIGLLDVVSNSIEAMEIAGSIRLPGLRGSKTVFLYSDYGGFHKGANQEVYSFLLLDEASVARYKHDTRLIRDTLQNCDRTVSFKRLLDGVTARMVPHFLAAADRLNGILFSVGVDKSIKYMIPDAVGGLPDRFNHWQTGAFERMLRIANVATMLFACLLVEGQNVVWISDEDQIMSSDRHGQDAVEAMTELARRYFPIKLGSLTAMPVSRVRADDRPLAEDLLCIPDLAAGALCDFTTGSLPDERTASTQIVVPVTNQPRKRARPILNWYADESQSLKKLFLELGPTDDPKVFSVYFRSIVRLPRAASSPHVLTL